MPIHPYTDLDAFVAPLFAGAPNTAGAPILMVAAGAGDNTEVVSAALSIAGFGSAILHFTGLFSLAATETLALEDLKIETSDDITFAAGVTTADLIAATTVLATGGGGGTDESVNYKVALELQHRNAYARVKYTPDLSAGATDTGWIAAVLLRSGATDSALVTQATIKDYAS